MSATGMEQSRPVVVVLGAGPAGSAAAAVLARSGFRTLLAGRANDARPGVGECLPPGVRPHLEKAGVWEAFLRDGHMPSAGIRSLWGSPEAADRDFVMSPYGAGWHLDRARFDATMRESALRCGAEPVVCNALRNAARVNGGWRLELADDSGTHVVYCSFVVDATGRSSAFARRVGAKRRALDRLVGVAGYFSSSPGARSHEAVLLVEAVENGWWYTAPLPDEKLIAVFLTDADHVQDAKLPDSARWLAALGHTTRQGLRVEAHGGALEGGVRIMPAESSFLDQVAGEGWIAAGDAAAAFDPLSSQGITSAVSGGFRAGQAVVAHLGGDAKALSAYAGEIRREYVEYLAHREIYYAMERRWPASTFWASRRAPPAALSAAKSATAMEATA
jgi:flavin-dependent dehydrogenase